jgi:ATP-dependent RNA helicase DeaD
MEAGAQLVVGTPGRILDHLLRRSLRLDDLQILIFDEADRMLSVGFYPDIKAIEPYLPKKRNGYLFSATFPPRVKGLAREFLDEPEMLSLSTGSIHAANTEHICYEVPAMEKDRCLVRLIELKNPDSAIVFCNTRDRVNFVTVVLQRLGYDADQLSSDLTQAAREKVLKRIHEKKLKFLVATDVAARGIDIENLSHVFLFEFPEDQESYIHRVGRTGRAGASGEAISIVDSLERLSLKAVARDFKIDVVYATPPTDEDVEKIVTERTTALLEAKLRGLDRLVQERLKRMLPLAESLNESDEERLILAMLLDEFYQKSLHEPVDGPPAPPERVERRGGGGGGGGREGSGGGRGGGRRGGGRRGGRGGGGGRRGGR